MCLLECIWGFNYASVLLIDRIQYWNGLRRVLWLWEHTNFKVIIDENQHINE